MLRSHRQTLPSLIRRYIMFEQHLFTTEMRNALKELSLLTRKFIQSPIFVSI